MESANVLWNTNGNNNLGIGLGVALAVVLLAFVVVAFISREHIEESFLVNCRPR